MRKSTSSSQATPENSWAETHRYITSLYAETDKKFAKTDKKFKETGKLIKENALSMKIAGKRTDKLIEEIKKIMKETALSMKDTDRRMKETDRRMKETDRIIKENALSMKETDRQMKELQKELSGFGQSQGSFAEEYFYNSFKKGEKNFFGKRFDDIQKNVKGRLKDLKDEYDIVLYNSNSVAIVEVKFKVKKDHIASIIKKAGTFKTIYPYYKDFNIYLGLASLVFPAHLEQECINTGIAIIKQVGDNVIINDAHLKAF